MRLVCGPGRPLSSSAAREGCGCLRLLYPSYAEVCSRLLGHGCLWHASFCELFSAYIRSRQKRVAMLLACLVRHC